MDNDSVISILKSVIERARDENYLDSEITSIICLAINRSKNDEEFADELYYLYQEIEEV